MFKIQNCGTYRVPSAEDLAQALFLVQAFFKTLHALYNMQEVPTGVRDSTSIP